MVRNPYSPVGWRNESHRHYLAAKGISTKKYFAKGNPSSGLIVGGKDTLHSLWASGKTNEQIARNPLLPTEIRQKAAENIQNKRKSTALFAEQLSAATAMGLDAVPEVPMESAEAPITFSSLQEEEVPFYGEPVSRPTAVPELQELPPQELPSSPELAAIESEQPAQSSESLDHKDVVGETVMTPGVPEVAPYGFE